MKALRRFIDKRSHHFEKGGRWARLYPLYEAIDTFLYTSGETTTGNTHVRDGIDFKRMMMVVVLAVTPCAMWGAHNAGRQANWWIGQAGEPLATWHTSVFAKLGFVHDPDSFVACLALGALYLLPIYLVTFAVGGGAEVVFAIIRKKHVEEGFLVTGMLFPLILPPHIPLWQVALGILFGVVIGKEVFGGTGMNFLNPALVGRAFLFFAYPAQISGNVWVAADPIDAVSGATWATDIDAVSGATPLAHLAVNEPIAETWWEAFVGVMPGSVGETSALLCAAGALLLIITRIGSWRIMAGVLFGTIATATLLNQMDPLTNGMLAVPWHWHVVLGGWAFGTAFMATDPVSAAFTETGKLVYGFGIGVLVILIRCVNPAYPEGMMLAILFMNMFAPLIDHYVVRRSIRRRLVRTKPGGGA